jgi:hypothetical protein
MRATSVAVLVASLTSVNAYVTTSPARSLADSEEQREAAEHKEVSATAIVGGFDNCDNFGMFNKCPYGKEWDYTDDGACTDNRCKGCAKCPPKPSPPPFAPPATPPSPPPPSPPPPTPPPIPDSGYKPTPLSLAQMGDGAKIFMGLGAMGGFSLLAADTNEQKTFWKEPNDDKGDYSEDDDEFDSRFGNYRHSDELKGFGTVMLAYNMAVYNFPNGANGHCQGTPFTRCYGKNLDAEPMNLMPTMGGVGSWYPNNYCQIADPAMNGEIDFAAKSELAFNYEYTGEDAAFFKSKRGRPVNAQAAIYKWKRPGQGDQIVTLVTRGSETAMSPSMDMSDPQMANDMMGDWFGSDASVYPAKDRICNHPQAKIHNGFQNAWEMMRWDVTRTLISTIEQMKAESPELKVKVMISGHSLGAAMASLAMYDFSCNLPLGQEPDGLITYGHPITFFGKKSMRAYTDTVNVTKRMRVNACSRQVEHVRMRNLDPDARIYQNMKDTKNWKTRIGSVVNASKSAADFVFNVKGYLKNSTGLWGGAADAAYMCGTLACCEKDVAALVDAKFGTREGHCEDKPRSLDFHRKACKIFRENRMDECRAENSIVSDCISARTPENMFASCDAVGTDFPKNGLTRSIKGLNTIALTFASLSAVMATTGPLGLIMAAIVGGGEGLVTSFQEGDGGITPLGQITAGTAALKGAFEASKIYTKAALAIQVSAIIVFFLSIFSKPFKYDGYYQTDDDDFQAAWVKKVHPDQDAGVVQTGSCFGFPNALLCHLLDAYSEGMRRSNDFNGGICARIDDSDGSDGRDWQLTPFDDLYADDPISVDADLFDPDPEKKQYGANQIGYPSAVVQKKA